MHDGRLLVVEGLGGSSQKRMQQNAMRCGLCLVVLVKEVQEQELFGREKSVSGKRQKMRRGVLEMMQAVEPGRLATRE